MVELIWDNKKEMLEEVNSEDFLKTDKHFEYNKDESRNKWNRGQIIVKITKLRVTSFKR